jgi:hypothetical protein
MLIKSFRLLFAFCALGILFTGCGDSGGSRAYTDINVSSGFSASYLQGKSFYLPQFDGMNNFILALEFTDRTISWHIEFEFSDRFFSGTADYAIVAANGINGIIQYNDGFSDVFYNVQSVESNRIMVCSSNTDIGSVAACAANQAYPWYFDRETAFAKP